MSGFQPTTSAYDPALQCVTARYSVDLLEGAAAHARTTVNKFELLDGKGNCGRNDLLVNARI
jgi:hypothetical protein